MSDINVDVAKTNDPSYGAFSQGTDRASLQPLASVPELSTKYVSPDYQANKTAGSAIKEIGDLGEAGLKLTDAVIQKKADDVLTAGIDKIRDSFGVGAAASGNGVAEATAAAGQDNGTTLTDPAANQPVALNRLGNRISGLTEAYQQGGLSNSAYYAKLETFVRETKSQFPGYNDQIDSMVASKVGTTPANALRSSLLQDVEKLQSKVQGQADKWTTYEHTNAQYIYTQWPNYDQMKQDGTAPSRLQVESAVGSMQARDYKFDSIGKRLALNTTLDKATSDSASDTLLQKGSDITRTLTLGTTNAMGIRTPADFQRYMADVNSGKRAQPTPDEKQMLTGLFATMKQQATAQFDAFANKPLADNTHKTWASVLGDKSKLDAARTLALSDINTIEDGLLNEKHGLVASTLLHSKAVQESADDSLLKNDPNAAIYGAVRRQVGDTAMSSIFLNDKILPSALEGLRQAGWVDIAQNKSTSETMDKLKKESNNNGDLIKKHIDDSTNMVIHQDRLADKTLGDSAFNHLFGPGNSTLIDSFQSKSQARVFTDLVSPTMTAAVAKRSKADQTTYVNWASDSFGSVFETQAQAANQSAEGYKSNGNLSLRYNPDAQAFVYEGARGTLGGMIQAANQRLQPLNSAISSMKEVFKLTGKDPTAELYRILPIAGIDPGTPIYNAIQREFLKQGQTNSANP